MHPSRFVLLSCLYVLFVLALVHRIHVNQVEEQEDDVRVEANVAGCIGSNRIGRIGSSILIIPPSRNLNSTCPRPFPPLFKIDLTYSTTHSSSQLGPSTIPIPFHSIPVFNPDSASHSR
jgi:hypothetical protein